MTKDNSIYNEQSKITKLFFEIEKEINYIQKQFILCEKAELKQAARYQENKITSLTVFSNKFKAVESWEKMYLELYPVFYVNGEKDEMCLTNEVVARWLLLIMATIDKS